MRCVRRRNEATERSRISSALNAVTRVRRPRRFSPPARATVWRGCGTRGNAGRRGDAAAALRLLRLPAPGGRRPVFDRQLFVAKTLLGDFAGLALGLFVVLAALFFVCACALRRLRARLVGTSRVWRRRASSSAILRSSARATARRQAHARARRVRLRSACAARRRIAAASRGRSCRRGARFLRRRGRCTGRFGAAARSRPQRLGLGLGRADPAFDLLDDDLLAAAMAEALAHHALLDAWL